MRVFLTGATGYIGAAVLDTIVRAGHGVTALVRTPEAARVVQQRGAHPVTGDLAHPASYAAAADGHEAYVLAAMESSARGPEIDRLAIETLLEIAGRRRETAVVYTSGVWVLGSTPEPAGEDAPLRPVAKVTWRPVHERLVCDATRNGLRTIVVRPGIVYGSTRGIVGDLFRDASNGLMRVIGEGENRWPLVYDRDLANLYVRLLASPSASGIYHATDDSDERVKDLVTAIAKHMPSMPEIRHVPIDEARAKLGPVADALALDQVVRSPRARALGWTPTVHSVCGNVSALFEEWQAGRR